MFPTVRRATHPKAREARRKWPSTLSQNTYPGIERQQGKPRSAHSPASSWASKACCEARASHLSKGRCVDLWHGLSHLEPSDQIVHKCTQEPKATCQVLGRFKSSRDGQCFALKRSSLPRRPSEKQNQLCNTFSSVTSIQAQSLRLDVSVVLCRALLVTRSPLQSMQNLKSCVPNHWWVRSPNLALPNHATRRHCKHRDERASKKNASTAEARMVEATVGPYSTDALSPPNKPR